MLANASEKIKGKIGSVRPFLDSLILALIIVLVGLLGFGLGRLSRIKEQKKPIIITNGVEGELSGDLELKALPEAQNGVLGVSTAKTGALNTAGEKTLVASKNGTKYYYLWCAGVQRIKEENKVFFATKEEAQKAGLSPASNCEGL